MINDTIPSAIIAGTQSIQYEMEMIYVIRNNSEWENLTHEEKNHILYLKQKEMLEQFHEKGAITDKEFNKSLCDLTEKMEGGKI
jgi:hypothetical protein